MLNAGAISSLCSIFTVYTALFNTQEALFIWQAFWFILGQNLIFY